MSYASEDFVEAIPLVEQLKGWRKRAVYVDGEQLPWDAVFGFLWCYNRRLGSYEPERYCFGAEGEWQANLWGCIQAEMPFRAGAAWLTWGRWLTEDGDWQFELERILHELRRSLHRYRFCPSLEMSFVENVVSHAIIHQRADETGVLSHFSGLIVEQLASLLRTRRQDVRPMGAAVDRPANGAADSRIAGLGVGEDNRWGDRSREVQLAGCCLPARARVGGHDLADGLTAHPPAGGIKEGDAAEILLIRNGCRIGPRGAAVGRAVDVGVLPATGPNEKDIVPALDTLRTQARARVRLLARRVRESG